VHPNGEPRVAAWVKTDPQGPLVPVGEGLLPGRMVAGSWVWIDVTAPDTEVALTLGERFQLPDHIVEDAVDPGVFPKWEDHGERLLAVFHLPTAGDDQLDTMPVVGLVGADLLLTFHPAPHAGLDWLLDAVATHAALSDGGPDQMLGRLFEFSAREFLPLVEECDVAFDALSDRALQGDPGVLPDSQAFRRDAATLRSVLGPQREVALGLAGAPSPLLDEEARRNLRDAYDRHHRLVEELDAARMLLATVADTYRAAVAERTNDVMKVLTVFSAMLLPLSLVAGIYGMNFENMPELDEPWAYFAALGLMALIAVGLWTYFVRRGFIGGLRVPKVTRRVGRGLVGVARAPVRTVGNLVLRPLAASPAAGRTRTRSDLDRETIEVVADLFRLGWQAPRVVFGADDDRTDG
jgi:magnesium transporter